MEAEGFVFIAFFFSFLEIGLCADCQYNQEAKASYHAKYYLFQCCRDVECCQVVFNRLDNSAVFYSSEVSVSDPNAISFWKKSQHVMFQTPINFLTSPCRVSIPGRKFRVGSKVTAVFHPVLGFTTGSLGIALESSYDGSILIYANFTREVSFFFNLNTLVLSCRWGKALWALSQPYKQLFPYCANFQHGNRVEISFFRTRTTSVLVTIHGLTCNQTEFNYNYSSSINPDLITHVLLENYGELDEITIRL